MVRPRIEERQIQNYVPSTRTQPVSGTQRHRIQFQITTAHRSVSWLNEINEHASLPTVTRAVPSQVGPLLFTWFSRVSFQISGRDAGRLWVAGRARSEGKRAEKKEGLSDIAELTDHPSPFLISMPRCFSNTTRPPLASIRIGDAIEIPRGLEIRPQTIVARP